MKDYQVITIYGWMAALLILYFLAQPYFEMRTFNKFSNQKATYFDAVFSNLRIINK